MPDSFDQFFDNPKVRRLISIAQSDNSLIALDVQKREISWTMFMAWLLNPTRQSAEAAIDNLQCFIDRLQLDSKYHITLIDEVTPEHDEGKAGRLDLLIRCRAGDIPIRIVIENKIDSTERENQLAGYVNKHVADLGENEVLLPVLIELGDHPAGKSSCPDAIFWNRQAVSEWLTSLPNAPNIVGDYLDIFEAWDTALELKNTDRRAIEELSTTNFAPPDWTVIEDWLEIRDRSFFQEVLDDPHLSEVLDQLGFTWRETSGRMRSNNDFLRLSKDEWLIKLNEDDNEGVHIHFESKGRGQLQLDIELYPYKGGLAKDKDGLKEKQPLLKLKENLHRRVRGALTTVNSDKFEVVMRLLRKPSDPVACMAAKFMGKSGQDCSPKAHAEFTGQVLLKITQVVDITANAIEGQD